MQTRMELARVRYRGETLTVDLELGHKLYLFTGSISGRRCVIAPTKIRTLKVLRMLVDLERPKTDRRQPSAPRLHAAPPLVD